jgi:hypothetical protein
MQLLSGQTLNRFRTPPQALADLMAKHGNMRLDHPERPVIVRMIQQLQSEIACRPE